MSISNNLRSSTIVTVRYHRRPVWQPSGISRLLRFLKGLLAQLTLRRTVLTVIVLPVLFYIYREVSRDALIIDPFSVPEHFEQLGLRPEVVADRIGDALRQIEADARTQMKKDNLVWLPHGAETPDVEIPGTGVGLKTFVELTRAVFGIHPKHVSGDIIALGSDDSPSFKSRVRVTVYLTEGRKRSAAINLVANTADIDVLSHDTAEMILEAVNPYILAAYQHDHGEVEKPLKLLQSMVQDPSQDRFHVVAALILSGNILSDMPKYREEAASKYQKAIELDPKEALAYNNWGLMLDDEGRYDEAAAKYRKAVELDPKGASAYNNWGALLYEQEKYEEASAKYQRAIELDAKYALAYNNWGLVLGDQEKYDDAAAKYQKAIELDPKYAPAYSNWGLLLYERKRYDDALAKYQKAVELDPSDALVYNNWGLLLSAQKKYDDAGAKYQKAIEFDPTSALIYSNWGLALYNQKKYDNAVAKYKKAVELDPKYAAAYSNWGLLLYERKRYDDALAKYQRAIELDPKYALAYNNWGLLLKTQRKYEEAAAKYRKAIELNPEYMLAYNNWGNVLREQKKFNEAEQKFAKARELSQ